MNSYEPKPISESTKAKIIDLWRTPTFPGSFLGLSNIQLALKLDQNIDISQNELRKIMQSDNDFLVETHRMKKRFPRRTMNVHGYNATWQSDLGFMFKLNNFIVFLVCIDIFSRKIFCKPIQSKSGEVV